VQESLSAVADGEESTIDAPEVEPHLRSCPACRAFRDALESSRLPDRIVRAAPRIDRSSTWWVLRALLVLVAVGYLVAAVPELLFSADPHHGHLAHHLGVFELAFGATLLVVAVRPARARAMVPFTVVLAIGMAIVAVIDVRSGEAIPLAELSHLLELASLVLVWLLATRRGWPGHEPAAVGPAPVEVPSPPHLRIVPPAESADPDVSHRRTTQEAS
jgi:predicted anti-sigma-YlaC factor YlaD